MLLCKQQDNGGKPFQLLWRHRVSNQSCRSMPSLETKSRRIYLLIIYIDDILIVAVKTMIEDTVTKLRKSFSIKEVQSLDDYFGI